MSSVSSSESRSSGLTSTNEGRPLRVTKKRSCSRSTRSASSDKWAFASENAIDSVIGQYFNLFGSNWQAIHMLVKSRPRSTAVSCPQFAEKLALVRFLLCPSRSTRQQTITCMNSHSAELPTQLPRELKSSSWRFRIESKRKYFSANDMLPTLTWLGAR